MSSSLFDVMAMVLVAGPDKTGAGSAPDSASEKGTNQPIPEDQQHLSLVKADPNVFYADVAFFANPPARPATATCSIGVRCGHSQALIVCHSCARFEGGRTHYCRNCFKAYHPWYRVAHKWSPLEDAESIKEELDRHAYTASLERDVADIRGLLAITASWTGELDTQDVDTKGNDLIKDAARDATRVAIKLRDLADMTCEDRTKVSTVAVDNVLRESVWFQKNYEAKDMADAEAGTVEENLSYKYS